MSGQDVEQEKLFDHEYDGIREFDNPMPRWWVYIFVGSILFCFPYVAWYHYGDGQSVQEAYEAEIAAFAERLIAQYGELKPDRDTLLAYMDDDTAMAGMSQLFKGKCAPCHLASGAGNVGPNLTDDRWINVRRITDIPGILRSGVVTKGMPAWSEQLTDTQIVLLSSYVARLTRDPQPGRPAEGEHVIESWAAVPSEEEEAAQGS